MSSNILLTTRGDTFRFNIKIIDPDTQSDIYYLTDDDVLYLGIMLPHQPFEDAIIKKRFTKQDQDTEGFVLAEVNSEYTQQLKPGIYYYAVKLRQDAGKSSEQIVTIINKTKLVVND